MLGIVVALVLLGSVVFAAPSSNATISFIVVLGILLVGGHLNKVAVEIGGAGGTLLYGLYFPSRTWSGLTCEISSSTITRQSTG